MSLLRALVLLAALALPFGTAQAVNWNEAFDGDLSDDGDFPTLVGTLSLGSNLFSGTMGSLGGVPPLDADIWNFTVDAGYYLTGINLTGYTSASGNNNDSFVAIALGATINVNDPSNHLSNALWNKQLDGFGDTYTNLLALLDAGPDFGGIGFDGPLPAGNYTFWIQEGSDQIDYQIDFVTSAVPVPEPRSALLLGLAGLLLLRRRR
ncbi:MAG: hypothetical protein JWR15_1831 [Prosthecobacter sp.]|nr:hypothetical protein [Prosthecobacter sp.]